MYHCQNSIAAAKKTKAVVKRENVYAYQCARFTVSGIRLVLLFFFVYDVEIEGLEVELSLVPRTYVYCSQKVNFFFFLTTLLSLHLQSPKRSFGIPAYTPHDARESARCRGYLFDFGYLLDGKCMRALVDIRCCSMRTFHAIDNPSRWKALQLGPPRSASLARDTASATLRAFVESERYALP